MSIPYELYEFYNHVIYMSMKYSITLPLTLAGNLLDLGLLNLPKTLINVTPVMTRFPFFKNTTRIAERAFADENFFNKGFAGLFRAVSTLIIEIPVSITASITAAVLAIIVSLLTTVISLPIIAPLQLMGR